MTDPRYAAHAARAATLARVGSPPLDDYWYGYRLGMARTTGRSADSATDDARDARAAAALRGEDPLDPHTAVWCGYHDGRHWQDVTQHRGLLRLAIQTAAGGSVRGFAREMWGVDDASVRQMLAGTRPVPATRHAELLDLVSVR